MKKIFIADDDQDVLDVLKLTLDKAGYKTETTLNGKVLLNNIADDFDLILLDIRMSGVDGLIICKHLKSLEETRNIPIIMVSAVPELETLAKNAGADDFLEKPFNISSLLHVVRKHV